MRKIAVFLFLLLVLCIPGISKTQDSTNVATKEEVGEVKGAVDGINETLLEMKSTLDALKKIKISGYIQAQYRVTDTPGAPSYAGGNFPANVRSQFQVRRGRFKINYDNDLTQYVIQLDVTQGGVGIKDAYVSVKEPWLKIFGLTAGVFDRPFGFEISYSSSNREAPERSRLFQTLFPGERELGAKIEITPENGPLSFLNLKAGLFNGVLNTANENDRNKDFIGRLGFQLPFQEANLAIDGGVSLYSGNVTSNSKFIYSTDKTTGQFVVDSSASNNGESFSRSYYGGDIQIYYDIPVIGGASLRAEYIEGKQPGTSSSSSFYNQSASNTQMYTRNFRGYYINYVQNIGIRHQIVVKYDVYDPNTDVYADGIGAAGSNLSATDIKYTTLGFGWVYHWDSNVKFVFYYDNVMNEIINEAATGSLAQYKEDVKDNVFTLRVQYKF